MNNPIFLQFQGEFSIPIEKKSSNKAFYTRYVNCKTEANSRPSNLFMCIQNHLKTEMNFNHPSILELIKSLNSHGSQINKNKRDTIEKELSNQKFAVHCPDLIGQKVLWYTRPTVREGGPHHLQGDSWKTLGVQGP